MNYLAQAHAASLDPRFQGPEEITCHADYLCPKCEADKKYLKMRGISDSIQNNPEDAVICGVCGTPEIFVLIED